MTRTSLREHRRVITGAVAGLVVAVGAGLLVHAAWPTDPATQAREAARERAAARVHERGLTDKVTVATHAGTAAQPSSPRPAKLPPMVRAGGACNDVLNSVRDLMDSYPTGLVLPAKGMDTMNGLILDTNRACSTEVARAFIQQEVMPWQTWQVPAGYKLPAELKPAPEPTKPKKAKKATSKKDTGTGDSAGTKAKAPTATAGP